MKPGMTKADVTGAVRQIAGALDQGDLAGAMKLAQPVADMFLVPPAHKAFDAVLAGRLQDLHFNSVARDWFSLMFTTLLRPDAPVRSLATLRLYANTGLEAAK